MTNVHPRRSRRACSRFLGATALALAAGSAVAADVTLSGSFTSDDQVAWWIVTLDTAATVSVTSLGYAGGVDTQGTVHSGGGFDSMLFLYSAAGTLVAQSDDGVNAATDPTTGLAADAGFSRSLTAGNYVLALSQYDNFALGDLEAGFSQAGTGNFTPSMSPDCKATSFCDWSGAGRTGHWVLTFSGVSAVPEPGAWALMLAGLAGIAHLRHRRKHPV